MSLSLSGPLSQPEMRRRQNAYCALPPGAADAGAQGLLLDYGARRYYPGVGRFISPDTIVPDPGNPQSLNRYAYGNNNPLRYSDPSGHFSEDEIMKYLDANTWEDVLALFEEGKALAGRWGFLELLREAELGSRVQILDGWDYWSAGTVDDYTIGSGSLVERDGRLSK